MFIRYLNLLISKIKVWNRIIIKYGVPILIHLSYYSNNKLYNSNVETNKSNHKIVKPAETISNQLITNKYNYICFSMQISVKSTSPSPILPAIPHFYMLLFVKKIKDSLKILTNHNVRNYVDNPWIDHWCYI